MDRFRFLASSGPLFARPLDWAMGVIAEAGYDGIELMVTQDPATQDPEAVRRASEREGMPVPVVHGPFLLLTRRVFGTDQVGKATSSLELASELGAHLMVVHPPFRWQGSFHSWLVEDAEEAAAELGTRVGVENLFPVSVAGRPVRFHRYTEPAHLAPFPHLVFDTSHFAVANVDIVSAWGELQDRTEHLHLSDNRGQGRDSHAPLGHGILPLATFLRAVTDSDYRGPICLELDCRRYLDDRAALVGYLRQEREKCIALLEGASSEEVLGRPDHVDEAPDDGMKDGGATGQPVVPVDL